MTCAAIHLLIVRLDSKASFQLLQSKRESFSLPQRFTGGEPRFGPKGGNGCFISEHQDIADLACFSC